MAKDTLFLLRPGFTDPAQPERQFLCPACTLLEGLLALYPALRDALDIVHVDFPRPRAEVIALAGPDHQGLPLLVSTQPGAAVHAHARHEGRYLIQDAKAIADYFASRLGSPWLH